MCISTPQKAEQRRAVEAQQLQTFQYWHGMHETLMEAAQTAQVLEGVNS